VAEGRNQASLDPFWESLTTEQLAGVEAVAMDNRGPIVLMIENHRSGLLWALMRQCPYLVTALRRAGFTGGWLA
jgi:hypothetical protein